MSSADQATTKMPIRLDMSSLVPIGAFVVGVALQFAEGSLHHLPMSLELLLSVGVIGLVFWAVFAVLHHAEAIADRIGEPFGTLVLTVSVTVIEASVILSMMLQGQPNPTIARESVFSTVMIVCGGMLGLCLVLGGWKHRQQQYRPQATSALLAVVAALSVLTLILPNYTLTSGTGEFSSLQLVFVSALCLLLYGSFVFGQMTRHRADFLDEGPQLSPHHPKSDNPVGMHLALLVVGLVGLVLLAEYVAATLQGGLEALHLPQSHAIVGAFIATLVLMPETVSAIRAALGNQLQRSLNIALGSACATIGLTVPVVAIASLATGHPLMLGLGPGDTVLMLLALGLSVISLGNGRTTILSGLVHLVVFAAYLLLILVP